MRFVMLIYQGTTPLPGSDAWKALPEAEQKAIYTDYAGITGAPGVTPGLPLGLPSAARTVRVRNGKPEVKNGTYLSECPGGYLVFAAENIDAAVALAARIPAARHGGAIEVRPSGEHLEARDGRQKLAGRVRRSANVLSTPAGDLRESFVLVLPRSNGAP
jgi:hypothetical protein